MKKNFALFISVICLFFIGWVYQTIRFEQLVKDEYLPLLEHYKENIAYESIEIDKFKFKVTLIKPKLSLKSTALSFVSDRLVFKQVPLTNKIYIDSYGAGDKSAVPEDVLYAPDHHISIAVNKPYFNSDFHILKIDIENNGFNLFDSKSDMKLLSLDKYNLSFNNRENDKDNYTLKISSSSKNARLGDVLTEFMSLKFFKLFPLPLQLMAGAGAEQKSSGDYYHFLVKLDEIIGGIDEKSDILITYPKVFLSEIKDYEVASHYARLATISDIFKKNFDIDIKNTRNNKFVNGKFNLKFYSNEHSKIEFDVSQDYNSDLVRNSEMIELTADYMQKVANRDLNKVLSDMNDPVIFSQDDFVKLLKPLASIRGVGLTGLFEYPRAEGAASHQFTIKMNNIALRFVGSGDKVLYNSEISLDNLHNLTKFAANYNTEAIQPTLIKIIPDPNMLERYQRFIMAIDKYGLDALNVLNYNSESGDRNNFLMKIKRDDNSKSLQINGKEWHQILEDPRIKMFIASLTSSKEEKEDLNPQP